MGLWVRLPAEPGESVLCVKTGSVLVPGTRLAMIGGLLVLTDQRLYHGPLDLRFAGRLLDAMGLNGTPAGLGLAIRMVVDWSSTARTVRLADIASVEAIGRSTLRVTARDGQRRNFGVAGTARTPIWSRKNTAHRDQMLVAVRGAVPGPRGG